MTAEQQKDRFTRLQEKLAKEPRCTSEEREAFAAEREAGNGTFFEWAQMQEDGSIGVRTNGYAADGTHGTGGFVVSPSDEDYEQAKQHYSLSKPGDTYHLQQKWVDGQWVTVLEERPNQKAHDGEARTA